MIGAEGAAALAPAITASGSLASIDFGYNSFTEAASLELLAAMKGKDMKSIGMAQCALGVAGAEELAEMVPAMGSLVELNLSGNYIGDDGAMALAPAIATSGSLASVTLERSPLPVKLPVKQLKGTEPVASIDLSKKGLGPLSAIIIAKLLMANASGSLATLE